MGKIKIFFSKIRRYYRRRKLYKQAEADASILCGPRFSALSPKIFIEGDKEAMLRETRQILYSTKMAQGEFRVERPDGTIFDPLETAESSETTGFPGTK